MTAFDWLKCETVDVVLENMTTIVELCEVSVEVWLQFCHTVFITYVCIP